MTHKEYNGWTNYETWLVKLWLDNDEGSQLYWSEQAERHFELYGPDDPDKLAEQLKQEHEDALPEVSGFVADLLNSAMSEVDWQEIAESLLNDAKEALAA